MSIPHARRPRLLCRLTRWRSSWLNANPIAGHGASCPDCRVFFAGGVELESALRRAARVRAPAPAGLEQGILAAVYRSQSGAPQRAARSGAGWPGVWVGVAAAVALIGLVWQWRGGETARAGNSSADTRVMLDATDALTERLMTSVLPTVVTTVADNALRQEADAVYADARSALHFLALNFLPSPPAGSPSGVESAPLPARPATGTSSAL